MNLRTARSLVALIFFATSLFAADITGTWHAQVETDAGSGSPTFKLQQTGEKLTGTYSGALGDAKVTGTVKGSDVVIEFEAQVPVTYQGKVSEDGKSMTGAVDLGGQAKGTFKATKQ